MFLLITSLTVTLPYVLFYYYHVIEDLIFVLQCSTSEYKHSYVFQLSTTAPWWRCRLLSR